MHTNFQFLLDRDVRKYPLGRRLNVYYDPKEPKNARLGRMLYAPVLSVALLIAFFSVMLYSGVVVGATLNSALFGSDEQKPVRAAVSDNLTYHKFPCSCSAKVRTEEGAQRVQISVGIFSDPDDAQKFGTSYRLNVEQSELSLPVTRSTAPSAEIGERRVVLGIACTPDSAIIVQGDKATAWPLTESGYPVWNTHLEQALSLNPQRAPEEKFDLTCRNLTVADGLLKVPVASSEYLSIRVSDGRMVGR
jgi:hypothetical protein